MCVSYDLRKRCRSGARLLTLLSRELPGLWVDAAALRLRRENSCEHFSVVEHVQLDIAFTARERVGRAGRGCGGGWRGGLTVSDGSRRHRSARDRSARANARRGGDLSAILSEVPAPALRRLLARRGETVGGGGGARARPRKNDGERRDKRDKARRDQSFVASH